MKLKNNKIIFEQTTCWLCDGKKIRTVPTKCPDHWKKTYNKKCIHCGGRGQWRHKYIGEHQETCYNCKGKGTVMENKFSTIDKKILDYIVDNANYIFKGHLYEKLNLDLEFLKKCYLGINVFAGYQDYIDHSKDDPEELLKLIKKSAKERQMQVLNYVDGENNLKLDIVYFGYCGGIEATWISAEAKQKIEVA